MNEVVNAEEIKYIIYRTLDNAADCMSEFSSNKSDPFLQGKMLAYYEVLDTIKNQLLVYGQTLSDYGLSDSIERQLFS